MADETLRFLVLTPQGAVVDERARSLRVPSDSGQVGLRPRSEAAALVVEPGLVLVAATGGLRFVATAGGLLRCNGEETILATPLAVVGETPEEVGTALKEALGDSSLDRELRSVLTTLEIGILQELGSASSKTRGGELGRSA